MEQRGNAHHSNMSTERSGASKSEHSRDSGGEKQEALSQGKGSHSPASEEQRQLCQITGSGDFSQHTESHKDQILVQVRNASTAA